VTTIVVNKAQCAHFSFMSVSCCDRLTMFSDIKRLSEIDLIRIDVDSDVYTIHMCDVGDTSRLSRDEVALWLQPGSSGSGCIVPDASLLEL